MSNPIWHSIQNAFHDGVNWVQGKLTSAQQEALKIATSAAHYVEDNGGKVLRDAAAVAVIAAQAEGGTGQEKLAAAIEAVTAVLVAQGIPLVKSAINLAIEMALADAKLAGLIN